MDENTIPEITRKLSKISEIMSDGYHFVKMREIAEKMERDAANGDFAASQVLTQLERFYNFCVFVEKP